MKILAGMLFIFFALSANAQTVKSIDILFVFDNEARTSIANKQQFVEDLMDGVRVRFVASGMPQLQFNHSVNTTLLGYQGSAGNQQNAIDYMEASPIIAGIRGSHDLVIMVSQAWTVNDCGAATPIPKDLYAFGNSENAAYAAIQVDGCQGSLGLTAIAHEIGHLLYAEHQVVRDENGNVDLADDVNGDATKPKTYNHGYDGGSSGTIMADPIAAGYSLSNFSTGSGSQDPFWEDVRRMFGSGLPFDGSWNVVANYREPEPPPPDCTLLVVQNQCQPYSTYPSFTIAAQLPGYSFNAAMVQEKTPLSLSWQDYYQGPPACLIYETFGLAMEIRALLNTASGISQCSATIPVPPLCH